MLHAILSLLVLAVAVFAMARLVPGVRCKGFGTAVVVAAGLSVVNFIAWKLLFFLTIPFLFLTGFLGYFIISAGALWLVDHFVEDFEIEGVGTLLMTSAGIALLNWVLTILVPGL